MGNMPNADNISAKYLSPNEVYEYKYVGEVKVGATNEQLPVSALKISSIIKITGGTEPNYFIQVRANKVEEVQCALVHISVFSHHFIHVWCRIHVVWILAQQSYGEDLTRVPTGQVTRLSKGQHAETNCCDDNLFFTKFIHASLFIIFPFLFSDHCFIVELLLKSLVVILCATI